MREHNERAWGVWMVGRLAQTDGKHYPQLATLQVSDKPKAKQSAEEIKAKLLFAFGTGNGKRRGS